MLVIWIVRLFNGHYKRQCFILQSFGVTKALLSKNPFYGFSLICGLVALASRGENLLFKISTFYGAD